VALRRDQLIPVKKAVNEKEQLEKGLEEEEEKKYAKKLVAEQFEDFCADLEVRRDGLGYRVASGDPHAEDGLQARQDLLLRHLVGRATSDQPN
jgi:hypothetical protein